MTQKIDQMFIDYIFNCLKANHPQHGYMFKGDDASDVADAWKDILYQRLQEKRITDSALITKKAYTYKCPDKPFPEVTDFILYLLDIPMPTKGWLKSVIMQIHNNERYNRHSPVKCTHRNNTAPIEHWEIAEKLAKRISENFGSTESAEIAEKMLQNAISDAVFRMDDIIPSKEPELSFTDIKKLVSTTTEKRNEELKKMLQNLGKRAN
jgi:hypothetical protein